MHKQFKTRGGILVLSEQTVLQYREAIVPLYDKLNSQRGALFTSNFEYPGRYTCWDLGFCNPPLAIIYKAPTLSLEALNERGVCLLRVIQQGLKHSDNISITPDSSHRCEVLIKPKSAVFCEEARSQQPSVFTLIREILALFQASDDPYLGLYGAFGYDLIFQFEALKMRHQREDASRQMVLYLPDEIYVVNHPKEEALLLRYDFQYEDQSTLGLAREGSVVPYQPLNQARGDGDHEAGEYAELVKLAKERFACGDLFEVVLSQTFYGTWEQQPSVLFKRMQAANPSPYGFFINLGEAEYLVGASPEMYVRVQGRQVETCPISGTVKRGRNALEDAENIQSLLDSEKERSELTMCTDVDRNDKSRICEAGSVTVVGRRQIEMYSRVIHTVDHVKGILREEFDAVDAFLSHMWVVTVTGAPKLWAMNFIEAQEKSPRAWYGGAVGWFGFDGRLNSGLVLRTFLLKEGLASLRVGATLLYDSVPEAEEEETRLKASAFRALLKTVPETPNNLNTVVQNGRGKKILLIDHQDSFVHTLANYFRQTGAQVQTIRFREASKLLQNPWDLVVLSPGPGRPDDFNTRETIGAVLEKSIPIFGVCLGLQALVEYFGGSLDILPYPMHGKPSEIKVLEQQGIFQDFDRQFVAGRYHSLHARRANFPANLKVTAETEDGIIMAIAHQDLAVHAVQFHPETIMSLPNNAGLRIISNMVGMLK